MAFLAQSEPYSGAVFPMFVEAKSYGTENHVFEEKDVRVMRRMGERFPGAVLVFATLRFRTHTCGQGVDQTNSRDGTRTDRRRTLEEPCRDSHWKGVVFGARFDQAEEPARSWLTSRSSATWRWSRTRTTSCVGCKTESERSGVSAELPVSAG